MRQLLVTAVALLAAGSASTLARAEEKVEVKGVHLCCGQCIKAVGAILSKVDGVSNAKCDKATKTVSFTAKDDATADNAFKSLLKGGFYGFAKTESGKTLEAKNKASKDKTNEVTVNNVHACCNACQTALKKLFPHATVAVAGKGLQRTVTISGENLEPATVLATLRHGGFNGTISKK
jgi:hypothetical protein